MHVELSSTDEAELSEVSSTENKINLSSYITQNQHLIMDDLWPFAVYTCRVAAYTVERGPFSEPLTIILSGGLKQHIQLFARSCKMYTIVT